jgi:hypothetical protein
MKGYMRDDKTRGIITTIYNTIIGARLTSSFSSVGVRSEKGDYISAIFHRKFGVIRNKESGKSLKEALAEKGKTLKEALVSGGKTVVMERATGKDLIDVVKGKKKVQIKPLKKM